MEWGMIVGNWVTISWITIFRPEPVPRSMDMKICIIKVANPPEFICPDSETSRMVKTWILCAGMDIREAVIGEIGLLRWRKLLMGKHSRMLLLPLAAGPWA